MFRALLAHLQQALHKRHLVYYVRVMSAGCTRIGVEMRSTPMFTVAAISAKTKLSCDGCNWADASELKVIVRKRLKLCSGGLTEFSSIGTRYLLHRPGHTN
jgi:hypothetical protein